MKMYTNVGDPNKKRNSEDTREVKQGSRSVVIQEGGESKAIRKKGDVYVGTDSMKEDRAYLKKANKGTGHYTGGAAPRVGGAVEKTTVASGKGTKKMIKKSVRNVKKSGASYQAKVSALRAYKK